MSWRGKRETLRPCLVLAARIPRTERPAVPRARSRKTEHHRGRVRGWVSGVCGPSERSVKEILFESQGGERNFAPSRKEGESITRSLAQGSVSSGYRYDPNGEELIVVASLRHAVGVRRLTLVECERLQSFPDGWTCLCDRTPCECPDSPRYRALGNAVTVNVAEWIGRRIAGAAA